MKNILLKTLIVFVVMSILNIELIGWSKVFFQHHYKMGGGILYSVLYLEFVIMTIIGAITVFIFRKNYTSLFRIALLFEILYLIILIYSGINPFRYFSIQSDLNLTELFFYLNSFVVLLMMYFVHLIYSKLILAKSKK
jgi:hypothetical protein